MKIWVWRLCWCYYYLILRGKLNNVGQIQNTAFHFIVSLKKDTMPLTLLEKQISVKLLCVNSARWQTLHSQSAKGEYWDQNEGASLFKLHFFLLIHTLSTTLLYLTKASTVSACQRIMPVGTMLKLWFYSIFQVHWLNLYTYLVFLNQAEVRQVVLIQKHVRTPRRSHCFSSHSRMLILFLWLLWNLLLAYSLTRLVVFIFMFYLCKFKCTFCLHVYTGCVCVYFIW